MKIISAGDANRHFSSVLREVAKGEILSVAAECQCRLLLTEDLQPGFVWRGVTVVNPYTASAHPLLQRVLEAR